MGHFSEWKCEVLPTFCNPFACYSFTDLPCAICCSFLLDILNRFNLTLAQCHFFRCSCSLEKSFSCREGNECGFQVSEKISPKHFWNLISWKFLRLKAPNPQLRGGKILGVISLTFNFWFLPSWNLQSYLSSLMPPCGENWFIGDQFSILVNIS